MEKFVHTYIEVAVVMSFYCYSSSFRFTLALTYKSMMLS